MITSRWLIVSAAMSLLLVSCSQKPSEAATAFKGAPVAGATEFQALQVGCAGCVFHMKGAEGCELAVKVDGKPYLVSGIEMPGHETGLCDHARTADLSGKLEGDRFLAMSMILNP